MRSPNKMTLDSQILEFRGLTWVDRRFWLQSNHKTNFTIHIHPLTYHSLHHVCLIGLARSEEPCDTHHIQLIRSPLSWLQRKPRESCPENKACRIDCRQPHGTKYQGNPYTLWSTVSKQRIQKGMHCSRAIKVIIDLLNRGFIWKAIKET